MQPASFKVKWVILDKNIVDIHRISANINIVNIIDIRVTPPLGMTKPALQFMCSCI